MPRRDITFGSLIIYFVLNNIKFLGIDMGTGYGFSKNLILTT